MRYYVEEASSVTVEDIEAGLRAVDATFRVDEDGGLHRGDQLLADIEVNTPGDGLFEDELGEFMERVVSAASGPPAKRVAERLRKTTAIVALQVLDQGRPGDVTLTLLAPIWEWLEANRRGLMHADGEGFYEKNRLVLELK
jgi:hypothetical protein